MLPWPCAMPDTAGTITLIGDESELPYERPPLSKQMLTAVDEPQIPHFHAAARYDERGIALLRSTRAIAIDPACHTVPSAMATCCPIRTCC